MIMNELQVWSIGGKMTGDSEVLRENLAHYPLSTTNPSWTVVGLNLGLSDNRPGTICLSYGTTYS